MTKRVAFNALSVSNLSGQHVLRGHLEQVLAATDPAVRHVLLHHGSNRQMWIGLEDRIDLVRCPDATVDWPGRVRWELSELPRVLERHEVQALFSPAGTITPTVRRPQLALAQNPWCLVPDLQRSLVERVKAALQRRAYRYAQTHADVMLFNSEYMQAVYRANGACEPKQSVILHQGIDDETYAAGGSRVSFEERPLEVLVVSVMARHKAVEDVVAAIAALRGEGVEARLTLVGSWPDRKYEAEVRSAVAELALTDCVDFVGHVSREQLYRHYSRAKVFCLLSRCESFGIPAIEAQAFGTPCVVADCGASPEIAGPGGIVVPARDVPAATAALSRLLTAPSAWAERSAAALKNSQRFHWRQCSAPLVAWLNAH